MSPCIEESMNMSPLTLYICHLYTLGPTQRRSHEYRSPFHSESIYICSLYIHIYMSFVHTRVSLYMCVLCTYISNGAITSTEAVLRVIQYICSLYIDT